MQTNAFRLGLTLSGGGFRATLFHLGVIRLLHDVQLLPAVKRIGSVSGGSILAAHLVLHWERYTGDDVAFDSAAREIITFISSDVRGRVIRRWILAWLIMVPRLFQPRHWTFTNLLQRFYARLYKSATLGDLKSTSGVDRPQVFFYCTSLSTGSVCSFDQSGFVWKNDQGAELTIAAPTTPVAFAITASSAFPPLFPPIAISHETLSCDRRQFPFPQYLSDGGVYDNLGIDQLISGHNLAEDLDLFLLSDAEGNFDSDFDKKYTFITTRNIRASDLLMKRVSTLQYSVLAPHSDRMLVLDIDTEVEKLDPSVLFPEDQRCLRNVRTDLDAFSPTEIRCLIQHGYTIARHRLIQQGLLPETAPAFSWESLPHGTIYRPERTDALKRARVRKLRMWSCRDWVSWTSLLVIICLSVIGLQCVTSWADLATIRIFPASEQSTLTKPPGPQTGFGFINRAFAEDKAPIQRFRLRQRSVEKLKIAGSDEIYMYDGDINIFPTRVMIFVKPPEVYIPRTNGNVLYDDLKRLIADENVLLEAKVKQGTEFTFTDKTGRKFNLKIPKVYVYIVGEDYMEVEIYPGR